MAGDRGPRKQHDGLPIWATTIVVLTLLGLLVYNFVRFGPEGLPGSYIIAGLLGGYGGLDQLEKRRQRNQSEKGDE